MLARLARLVLLLATSAGCAASAGAGGGGAGVELEGNANASGAGGRAGDRRCMYDRASGRLRTCLHFSFGRCALFGDPCAKEPPASAGSGAPGQGER